MPENDVNSILLVVGNSQNSHRAAQLAMTFSVNHSSNLLLLHIVDKMLVNRMKRVTGKSISEIEVELEENGWKYLYHYEDKAKSQGIPVTLHQVNGVIENEIVNHANRFKTDLIIMAYPEKVSGQMKRLVKGHIEKTIETSKCSVLIVK